MLIVASKNKGEDIRFFIVFPNGWFLSNDEGTDAWEYADGSLWIDRWREHKGRVFKANWGWDECDVFE